MDCALLACIISSTKNSYILTLSIVVVLNPLSISTNMSIKEVTRHASDSRMNMMK